MTTDYQKQIEEIIDIEFKTSAPWYKYTKKNCTDRLMALLQESNREVEERGYKRGIASIDECPDMGCENCQELKQLKDAQEENHEV